MRPKPRTVSDASGHSTDTGSSETGKLVRENRNTHDNTNTNSNTDSTAALSGSGFQSGTNSGASSARNYSKRSVHSKGSAGVGSANSNGSKRSGYNNSNNSILPTMQRPDGSTDPGHGSGGGDYRNLGDNASSGTKASDASFLPGSGGRGTTTTSTTQVGISDINGSSNTSRGINGTSNTMSPKSSDGGLNGLNGSGENGMMNGAASSNQQYGTEESDGEIHMPVWKLIAIASFNFPFGALCGPMGVAILPLEAEWLAPQKSSVMLGYMMGIVGITQLICPIAGKFSDVHRSRFGKRRPYLVSGAVGCAVCLVLMWTASLMQSSDLYMAALFFAMLALNVSYSASYGLIPDLVPKDDQGRASGAVGALSLFGALFGFVFLIGTYNLDFRYNYAMYIVLIVISTTMICIVAKEKDTSERGTPAGENLLNVTASGRRHSVDSANDDTLSQTSKISAAPRLTLGEIMECYTIDVSVDYDFLWVFIGRTLYYIAVSCQSFVLYYVRDVVEISNVNAQKYHVGSMGLLCQLVGGCVAFPAGQLSDKGRCGRKKLVYLACTVMSCVYISFLVLPLVENPKTNESFSSQMEKGMSSVNGINWANEARKIGSGIKGIKTSVNTKMGEIMGSTGVKGDARHSSLSGNSGNGSGNGSVNGNVSGNINDANGNIKNLGDPEILAANDSSDGGKVGEVMQEDEAEKEGKGEGEEDEEEVEARRLEEMRNLERMWNYDGYYNANGQRGPDSIPSIPPNNNIERNSIIDDSVPTFLRAKKFKPSRPTRNSASPSRESRAPPPAAASGDTGPPAGHSATALLEKELRETSSRSKQTSDPKNLENQMENELKESSTWKRISDWGMGLGPVMLGNNRESNTEEEGHSGMEIATKGGIEEQPNSGMEIRVEQVQPPILPGENPRRLATTSGPQSKSASSKSAPASKSETTAKKTEEAAKKAEAKEQASLNPANDSSRKEKSPFSPLHENLTRGQYYELVWLYFSMIVYGIGNGCYLAVDLALALDCLPNPETTAQSLGIWGVSAFLGLAAGPMLWGTILDLSGGHPLAGHMRNYPYVGYVFMLMGGCFACLMAGWTVKKIKKSH